MQVIQSAPTKHVRLPLLADAPPDYRVGYIWPMLADAANVARTLALILICVAAVAGVVLMAQGTVQGVALVLSAGLLGAAYARWVLNWRPEAEEAVSSRRPEPAPEDAMER
ncbi:MAG: hypothetical protein RMN52_05390 [Anaerolineae bacterium]|nr:hypothetical protein [Candidatus Roseilinea sp.]MDW8449419.1 hypothetical protein [Anaerolineae bacterium]